MSEQFIPEWALAPANGCWDSMAQLCTKDGRRMGNAVLAWWGLSKYVGGFRLATVITDAGTMLHLTERELMEFFHPPKFIMQSMLPAQRKAVEESQP